MTAQRVGVFRVVCGGPGDLSGAEALVEEGRIDPKQIVAVLGKTEGNGCVNDHTRDFATMAWCHFLAPHLACAPDEVHRRVALVMSGGTEGVLSPHFTVFTRTTVDRISALPHQKRLVVGVAHTRDFMPEEIGRKAQVDATAQAVRTAIEDAGIADADDVHFVQVKCPLLTSAKVLDARQRGAATVTRNTYESMGWSRGASALGVGLALGEFNSVENAAILQDGALYSARASVSAGIELEGNVVIVLGEAAGSRSDFRIAHTVMQDAVDATSVRHLLRNAFGLDVERDPAQMAEQLVALLAKAEAAPDGLVRGARHTMLNDSDIHSTRHARAVVGGVLASVVGQTALYLSGGAEHQGPPGGGPVAAIVAMQKRKDGALPPSE